MERFSDKLDELLQGAFQFVLKIEEQMLHSMGPVRLSISEIHLLEAVGKAGEGGRSVTELARELSIAPSSVTNAIKKLEAKGFLLRTKGERDARTVWITLTEEGVNANRRHAYFHARMVRNIAKDMQEDEQAVLLHAMEKLNEYFKRQLMREQ